MKHWTKSLWGRFVALALAITLLLTSGVAALTPDQLKILLQEHYLGELSDAVLRQDNIDAILRELDDPYTQYMNAKEYQALLDSLSDQSVGGIGASVRADAKGLYIVDSFAENPAALAGIKAGDIITEIDGKDCAGQDSDLLVSWLRGEDGSFVQLKVLHEDGSSRTYRLRRSVVVIPLATARALRDDVTYIGSLAFGAQTTEHFIEATSEYPDTRLWVVDMRTNPGGDVQATADTLGVFLGKEEIVYLKNAKDEYALVHSQQAARSSAPVFVLTSASSASAAEMFSAGLRDAGRGLLIGERTFGKGVSQSLLDQSNYPDMFLEGDALKLTSNRYYLARSASTADQIGVIPHLLVPAEYAQELALALAAPEPTQAQRASHLRLEQNGHTYYLDLGQINTTQAKQTLRQLLQAIAPQMLLQRGNAQGGWSPVTPEQIAADYGVSDFQSRYFRDISGRAEQDSINALGTYDIMRGEGGLFRPEDQMTRAELCALLVQALQLQSARKWTSFSDVSADAWYAQSVQSVVASGLMNGVGGGKFAPEGTVSQEEMITVLARAAASINAVLYESSKESVPQSSAVPANCSDWARKWIWLLGESARNSSDQAINMLHTAVAQVDAKAPATRAQTALTLYHILTACSILQL